MIPFFELNDLLGIAFARNKKRQPFYGCLRQGKANVEFTKLFEWLSCIKLDKPRNRVPCDFTLP